MSKLYVNELVPRDASVITAPNLQLPAGSVIQVQSTSDSQIITVGTIATWTATGVSVNITPKFATSKIIIDVSANYDNITAAYNIGSAIYRNGTKISPGDWGSTYMHPVTTRDLLTLPGLIIDTPNTTSLLTYQLYLKTDSGSVRIRGDITRTIIVVTEIAQ